jgi:hypothetical protein
MMGVSSRVPDMMAAFARNRAHEKDVADATGGNAIQHESESRTWHGGVADNRGGANIKASLGTYSLPIVRSDYGNGPSR